MPRSNHYCVCHSQVHIKSSHQKAISLSLMVMKTTTNTGKKQNFNRKVREEIVKAIQTMSLSLQIFAMIY